MLRTELLVALLSIPGVGRRTVHQLLLDYSNFTPTDIKSFSDIFREANSINSKIRVPTEVELYSAYTQAEEVMSAAVQMGASVLSIYNEKYPTRLRRIPDPPLVLYVKGDITCLSARSLVAVVGTRTPTQYGVGSAERIGATLAERGVIVVSGLALGCDTAAHLGCIRAGGRAVAILAHGLDRIYPADNRELADNILEQQGCLLTEYPSGVKPRGHYFVERDRLQSGLSDAVIVVETGLTGGTMHTVRFCLEQRKLLGCILHSKQYASNDNVAGNRQLIAEKKAFPLADKEDLKQFIDALQKQTSESSPRNVSDKHRFEIGQLLLPDAD